MTLDYHYLLKCDCGTWVEGVDADPERGRRLLANWRERHEAQGHTVTAQQRAAVGAQRSVSGRVVFATPKGVRVQP